MTRLVVFLILLMCVAPGSVASTQPAMEDRPLDLFDLGAPSFTNFSPRDGVPESVTVGIRTDQEGFVWVASPSGLTRYDGHRWIASADPGVAKSVDSLWLDHDGVMWAAFRDHGIAHWSAGHWLREDASTGLPSQQIRRFAETSDAQGRFTLWALTWDKGLMLHRDGRWMLDPDNATLPHGPILGMAQTHALGGHARLWAGSGNDGLWYREDHGGWQRFQWPGFGLTQIEYLFATEHAGHEELWITVFGSGLWRLTDEGLRAWTKEAGDLPTNDLYDITETPLPDGDRAIWVASRSGLVRIHDDRAQVYDRRHGLPSDVVRAVSAWRSPTGENVLWLATESGVSRTIIGSNQWLTASLMGSHATGVFSLLVEPDGAHGERLWVGSTDSGIGVYEKGLWRYYSQANGALPDSYVRMIKAAPDEAGRRTIWVGLRYGTLLRVRDGPVFETVPTPWPRHSGQAVLDILARQAGGRYEQWIATRQSGIYRWRDGSWTPFRADGVVGQWRIDQLLEQTDAGGRSWLWATTNQGLARYDGERWTLLGREAGLPDIDLIGVTRLDDSLGRAILWVGTTNAGIVRVNVDDPLHPVVMPNDLPAPPDLTAYSAQRDSVGRVYICTNNGVQQLTPAVGGYTSRIFTRRDGMVHDECNTDAQRVDAHDRFWTGTLGGLTVYDPEREYVDRQAKPLKITDVRIDGKSVPIDDVRIAPSARDIDIEFALLSWHRENESRFRTQLIGYDAAPGDWTEQHNRNFNALPPGRYVLRVEARDYAGNVSEPVELALDMQAAWWQRTWARALLVVAVLTLGYGLLIWRTRALEAQRRDLEARVAARTVELNEANSRLLELSYKDALTGLANRRRLLERLEKNPDDRERGTSTALIFVDVDFFKDYNDRFGHPAGDEALRDIATTMRRCAPPEALVARYGGEEFACLLPRTDAQQAQAVAERIRAAVAASDIAVPGSSTTNHITISAGVACGVLVSAADATVLLREADMALYQAKRDGRNNVCSLTMGTAAHT